MIREPENCRTKNASKEIEYLSLHHCDGGFFSTEKKETFRWIDRSMDRWMQRCNHAIKVGNILRKKLTHYALS